MLWKNKLGIFRVVISIDSFSFFYGERVGVFGLLLVDIKYFLYYEYI